MPAVASGVVAVTGANGFIGSHVVKQLLGAGYTVRAIVRDKDSEEKTAHLKKAAEDEGAADRLVLFSGDLMKAGDYDEAFAGADAVVHTAAFVVRPPPVGSIHRPPPPLLRAGHRREEPRARHRQPLPQGH